MSLELDALPENVELTILQPKVMEVYYRTCGVIDQHNRRHQDNLTFENQEETGDKEMGHEGQLDSLLNDCCG